MAYSSKYYDPVKAHEYYEKHKKLKGRTSTKGLNEVGKQAAKMVKENIREERKAFNDRLRETLKEKIKDIRERMKDAPKEERDAIIKQLREQTKSLREKAKAHFDSVYENELANIKKDKQFVGGSKKKGKKAKK